CHAGIEQAISRGLAYAPYADLVWCETSTPDLELARRFAQAIHAKYPANSVPAVVERINNTFRRADQIQWSAGIEPGD
ncbi:hypothetical protein QQ73_07810, partial [Candidatus Endoriftia persephone str. Guaymas]|nr:hypothetical protein [Candidatus Endoriftia persephone str. Guaymas]